MRTILILTALLISFSASAISQLQIAQRYQEVLELEGDNKNKGEAKRLISVLRALVQKDDPLYDNIQQTYLDLYGKKESGEKFEKALRFATGKKEEIFCKDKGLVEMKGFHDDGTRSRIVLVSNNRTLYPCEYSIIKEGRWMYQLDTDYREPVKSEAWIDKATEDSFHIEEVRVNSNGRTDTGHWKAEQLSKARNISYSSSGNVKEPIPMFMAMDYAAWGTPDLGYTIEFKAGTEDTINASESTMDHRRIQLKTYRKVAKQMAKVEITDFDGKKHKYMDCYLVKSAIKLDGIH